MLFWQWPPARVVGGSRAAADDTASGACTKQAFGLDQTQLWDQLWYHSGINSGVILGSILMSFWDQF